MKKINIVAIAMGVFISFIAQMGYASTTLPVFQIDKWYEFKYKNYEDWSDIDANQAISVGDKLTGILGATEIYESTNSFPNDPSFPFSPIWSNASSTDELTGTFDYTVTSVVPVFGSTYLVSMTGDFNIYHDLVKNFNAGYPGSGYSDGALWASLGTTFWVATGAIAAPWASPVASTNGGLYLVVDNTGVPGGWHLLPGYPAGTQFSVQSTIAKVSGLPIGAANKTNWTFSSNDPVHGSPAPEPTSMLLLGMGLVGLATVRRKKVA